MRKRDEEMEAVRTTIVGGRPPGSGRRDTAVPRGIEVLVKKAAVDEAFRGKLLAERGGAAAVIGLELDPAESAMLGVIAEEQLAGIIRQTVVPAEQRRVFMGTVAAAMLAVIGVGLAGCGKSDATGAQAGAPGQANSPQSLPQGEPQIIRGLRATPAETSTQTAPATGDTTPPNPPVAVFGLRMEPAATSTQPTPPPTAPAADTQPILMFSAGFTVMPATTTQPATGPGDASPTPPDDLPRAVAGAMAPRPPATNTQPATGPGDASPTPPDDQPREVAGMKATRPPATSTQPATGPGDTSPAQLDAQPMLVAGLMATQPPPPNVTIVGLMTTQPPATSTQPATGPGDASPTPPADLPRQVAGMMAPRPPETSTQPATDAKPAATDTAPATTSTAPATTRLFYGAGGGGGAGPRN